jgi:PAS domain S-box-containing protein
VTGADGGVEFVNQAYSQTLEAPAEQLLGDVWLDGVHPEDLDRLLALREEAWRDKSAYAFEVRMMHPGGQYRTMRISCRPRLDDHGTFQGYVGMSFDVTDLRQAEERQSILINELNHRVKNTLATVQSIIHQVLRKDPMQAETRMRITERLLALSSAHDVLTRQNWQYADLTDVIREAILPYTDPQTPRIELSGPPVKLAPNVSVAMSMALHELGTNALRHGALSAPSGRVLINWRIAETGAMELEWRERGGPRLGGPPTETGFGSRVLNGLIAEFGKAAELEFTPTGLLCRLTAPVAAV